MSCSICEYAAVHGCWPRDHRGTHCHDCHRSWTGLKEAHCTVCHEHFSTDGHAQSHRGPHGRCIPPADVLRKDGDPRMRLVERSSGPVWTSAAEFDARRFS